MSAVKAGRFLLLASAAVLCISLMSTPALKPRPSARRITTWVLWSRPAAVMASPNSNQPFDGIALTGGESTGTETMPGSTVLVVVLMRRPHLLLGCYLSKHLCGSLA